MSLPVAIQSAVFYYLACTPCNKLAHRKGARKQAKKQRETKARLEMEQPRPFTHPPPFSTNQFWNEEISMGPSLPKKGAGNKSTSHGKLQSAEAVAASSAATERRSSIGSRSLLHSGSSPTVVPEEAEVCTLQSMSVNESLDKDWNHKRYQREDEELWGLGTLSAGNKKLREVLTKAGESAGRLFDTTLGRDREVTNEDRHNFYFAPKNPPVNDYHPPVVSSMPTNKREYEWMLQPPPPAKFMEGKEPVKRSGSTTSTVSRRTAPTTSHDELGLGLGRVVGARLVNDKLRKARELPSEAELTIVTSQPHSPRTPTNSTMQNQHTTRSRSNTTESEGSSDTILERRRRRRASQQMSSQIKICSSEFDEDGHDERPVPRPRLETIASSKAPNDKSENIGTMSEPARSPKTLDSPRTYLDDSTNRPLSPMVRNEAK